MGRNPQGEYGRGVPILQGNHGFIPVGAGCAGDPGPGHEKPVTGVVRVRYAGIPGNSYTLEARENFEVPWASIEARQAGANGAVPFADLPISGSNRFFRANSP